VVVWVTYCKGISSIIFDYITVTRFATSSHDMYYLSKSLYVDTYCQSAATGYSSIIAGAPGDSKGENLVTHLEAIVLRISIFHHHHHSSV